MKKNIFLIFLLLTYQVCFADAGYLASITSGASPVFADVEHQSIEMTSEEVVIELKRGYDGCCNAVISTSFLFTNHGEDDVVLMAIPYDIITPFISQLYSLQDVDPIILNPKVKVNGEDVVVELLCMANMSKRLLEDFSWEELVDLLDILYPESLKPDEPIFHKNFEFEESSYDILYPKYVNPYGALAYWEVEIEKEESVLVEYQEEFLLTSDYNDKVFRLAYPLFTGATWNGDIGYGKITVVSDSSFKWDDIQFVYAPGLPLFEEEEDYRIEINSTISSFNSFTESFIKKYDNTIYKNALVWEFSNLEPEPAIFSYTSFYPDIGDIGAYYYSEFLENFDTIDFPWLHTQIYLFIGDFKPSSFNVISPGGTFLYDKANNSFINKRHINFYSSLNLIKWEEDWIYAEINDHFAETRDTGWIKIYNIDVNLLVKPIIMPRAASYYDEDELN